MGAQQAIFGPVIVMALITILVWFYLYAKRLPAIAKAKVDFAVPGNNRPGAVDGLPDAVNYPADNFKNLFEVPVLFYVVAVLLFATGQVDTLYVMLAWAFVVGRAVHSVIQCTYTRSCIASRSTPCPPSCCSRSGSGWRSHSSSCS